MISIFRGPMRLYTLIALLCAGLLYAAVPFPAKAETGSIQESYQHLLQAVKAGNAAESKRYATVRSASYIDKLAAQHAEGLIPADTRYAGKRQAGAFHYIKLTAPNEDAHGFIELAYMKESGQWKFDFPETMRNGLGDNWEEQLNNTLQLYQMLQAQGGLTAGDVKDMLRPQKQ